MVQDGVQPSAKTLQWQEEIEDDAHEMPGKDVVLTVEKINSAGICL